MEEVLASGKVQVERKLFYFDLKQNRKGRFLKITEDVRGRRDTIIIPSTGLAEFRQVLEELINHEAALAPFGEDAKHDDDAAADEVDGNVAIPEADENDA
jgi:hypothetical protein